jgi:type VI secretion system protein ImpL
MLNLLKSRIFLAGQGLVMLVVLVLVLGRVFHWSTTVQLIAIMAILVIGMIMLVVGYVRANNSASAIQKSISSGGEQQRKSVRPDNQAEIEQLQRDLEDAIERLRHSKLGKGKSGKSALYALPWYMIIGPPAAGKTTAIANSGLNFPIGLEGFRGVGGTRNCDWFFSDSAIFLDTAGRYMTEPEDTEEWNTFLETLRDNRKKQPINGVLVAISISELADATPEQIEWHAATIRRRIDDLVTRLDVTFPVYLLFTKCDLLRGFTQFFGALSRREREQVLGCTLPQDWEKETNLRTLFETEFDEIAAGLLNWRNEGLGLAMKRAERHLVYVFPLEFASVRNNLTQFVTMLFQPNPYRDTPAFRGFYFSSGTQEGLPIDRVLGAIAKRFGFAKGVHEEAEPVQEARAYFIKDIFEKVIIPDRFLVAKTSKAAVRGRVIKSSVAIATLLLLVLFVLGMSQAVVRSSTRLGRAQEVASEAAAVNAGGGDVSSEDIESLESLRTLLSDLERPASFGWGLDRGTDVRESARALLVGKVRDLVQGSVLPRLRERIDQTLRQPFVDASAKDSLEEDTKAYLLLTSYTAELDSANNAEILALRLQRVAADIPSLDDERMGRLMTAFVAGIRDGVADGFSAEPRLVDNAVRVLREPINASRLYNKLRRDSEIELGDETLEEMLSAKARYFDTNPAISRFFTQSEWTTSVMNQIAEYSAAPVRDAWVPWAVDAPEVDPEEFERSLTELYLQDYGNEWVRFVREARLKPFRDVRDAAGALDAMADLDESPILWLLSRVSHETTFPQSATGQVAGQVTGEQRSPQNNVERTFQSLHRLNITGAQSGEADPSLVQALNALRSAGEDLDGLSGDDAGIADYVAQVLGDRGGALEDYRRGIQSAMADQISSISDNLFERPVILAWAALLGEVQTHLDERWGDEVYDPYRARLEGKYPLGSGDDIPIRDFEDFFRPGTRGTFDSFVEEELARYLQDNRTEPRQWRGLGINLSRDMQSALENVARLQQTLYDGDNLRWVFTLEPDLPEKPASITARSYYLNIHGSTQEYDMGFAQPLTVTWPGDPDVILRVSLSDSELPPRQYRGQWALFKFLADADITPRSGTEFDLKWDMTRDVRAVYHARVQSSFNPLNERDLFSIVIPSHLGN